MKTINTSSFDCFRGCAIETCTIRNRWLSWKKSWRNNRDICGINVNYI